MQSNTTMRYCLTAARMTIIHKTINNRCWWGCGEKGTLMHCWWNADWCSHCTYSMEVPQKIQNGTAYHPGILLLGLYLKKPRIVIWKNMCTSVVLAVLLTIAQTWKQPKCPSTEWIKNRGMYMQWNITQSLKKNEILQFVTAWMDLEIIMSSEINQWVKNKYHMISLVCGI